MIRDSKLVETVIGTPPPGWTLGHATINLWTGKHTIEAMRRGAFAVHEIESSDGRYWRLSHAPTGLQVWAFTRMEDAIELAERIEPFAAWGETTKEIPPGVDLYPMVRRVIDEITSRGDRPAIPKNQPPVVEGSFEVWTERKREEMDRAKTRRNHE